MTNRLASGCLCSQECLRRKDELLRQIVQEVQQEIEGVKLKLPQGADESKWRKRMEEVEQRLQKVQKVGRSFLGWCLDAVLVVVVGGDGGGRLARGLGGSARLIPFVV